jgi:hypothetical protein
MPSTSHRHKPVEARGSVNGRNILFVNRVKYLGVIFVRKIIWRLHLETIKYKAFRTFIRIDSILKSGRLSTNIKLALPEAPVGSVMTYACHTWNLKLRHLKEKVLRNTGDFLGRMSVLDLHLALKIPYVYDSITKVWR